MVMCHNLLGLFGTDYCRNLSAAFQFFQQGKINPNHFDLCGAHVNAGVRQTCVEVSLGNDSYGLW
jgi:hypothetical protein